MVETNKGEVVLAIDIGGSKLVVGLVDAAGSVLCSVRRELLGSDYSRELILENTRLAALELESSPAFRKPVAVGASIPGPCDPVSGILYGNVSTGLASWHYLDDFSGMFGLPVYGDNDVNACAVAEKMFGNCRDVSHFLWVTVSFGCGGALYLENKLYRGAHFLAGEVGHIPVEFENPRRCHCGILGDLEIEGAGFAIGRKYLEQTNQDAVPGFSSKDVSGLARAGDKTAAKVFYQSGFYIGRICAMAQNLLDLQKAVIGGGVAVYDFDLLKPGIEAALADFVFPYSRKGFTVEKTSLGYHAALLGAAALALQA